MLNPNWTVYFFRGSKFWFYYQWRPVSVNHVIMSVIKYVWAEDCASDCMAVYVVKCECEWDFEASSAWFFSVSDPISELVIHMGYKPGSFNQVRGPLRLNGICSCDCSSMSVSVITWIWVIVSVRESVSLSGPVWVWGRGNMLESGIGESKSEYVHLIIILESLSVSVPYARNIFWEYVLFCQPMISSFGRKIQHFVGKPHAQACAQ